MKYSDSKIKALLYKYLTEEHPFKSDGPGNPDILENYENWIDESSHAILENRFPEEPSHSQDILLVVWEGRPECHDIFTIHPDRLEHIDRADL